MKILLTALVLCSLPFPSLGLINDWEHKIRESYLHDPLFPWSALRFGKLEIDKTTIQEMRGTLGTKTHAYQDERFPFFEHYCYAIPNNKQSMWARISSHPISNFRMVDTLLVTTNPEKIKIKKCVPITGVFNIHSGLSLGMSYDETQSILLDLGFKKEIQSKKNHHEFKFNQTYDLVNPYTIASINYATGKLWKSDYNKLDVSIFIYVEFKKQKLETIKVGTYKEVYQ